MNKHVTPDEEPKRKTAKRVITPKRKYFVPDYPANVEAESAEQAAELAKKQHDEKQDGDDASSN